MFHFLLYYSLPNNVYFFIIFFIYFYNTKYTLYINKIKYDIIKQKLR